MNDELLCMINNLIDELEQLKQTVKELEELVKQQSI